MKRSLSPTLIALAALLIALTTVFTMLIRIGTPARGYVNLSDVAITFSSLAFGPLVGTIAGGIGTAIADMLSGYAPFAPLSLAAHGLEGLLIGLVALRSNSIVRVSLAWLAGATAMVATYLVGEGLFYTGWPLAIAEVPLNALQAIVGALVGIPLVFAVRAAYPPIQRLGKEHDWTE